MTTIVAVQLDNKVVFGADSQVTAPNGRRYKNPQMVKISEVGQYLIAGSGECAPCDIAQHLWIPPKPIGSDWDDLYHFMIAKVVPSLKACFKTNEYKWNETDDDESKFSFLIAIGGQVFELADDMSITLTDHGFYGVGSGSSYAVGALAAGATVGAALKIAADHDVYTCEPFMFYEQEKRKKKRVV